MISAIEVNDSQSNRPELITAAVQAIGRSIAKRKVFEAIYKHKMRTRSVVEIAAMTKISTTRVLQVGGELAGDHIVNQTKKDNRVAYTQKPFYQRNKRKILNLLDKPGRAAKIPTKRNISVLVRTPTSKVGKTTQPQALIHHITIDDIDSFSKVGKIRSLAKRLPSTMSERQFNDGVKAIIGETGTFKDWGGETSDLFSTRIRFGGKRRRVAFGFKGPGLAGALVPSRLGKNGDQMERLFGEPADIFFVQHWREIMPSVLRLMKVFAVDRAASTAKPVYYGVIDGHDSNRLRLAYPSKFKSRKQKK
jgi:hypothetical protein